MGDAGITLMEADDIAVPHADLVAATAGDAEAIVRLRAIIADLSGDGDLYEHAMPVLAGEVVIKLDALLEMIDGR